jgi:Fe-S cluster biogenesis protein NfuA
MNTTISSADLMIRTLPTPNPNALKFVMNQAFKSEGKATFTDINACEHLPLVRDLFHIEGVTQIHLFQNTLTVTHDGTLSDDQLAETVEVVIRSRFAVHDPGFGEGELVKARTSHTDPTLIEIEAILDRTIRPGLQADGGDIEVLELKDNQLSIVYQGACGGCPSSMMGTLDAIQGIIRSEMNLPDLIVAPV